MVGGQLGHHSRSEEKCNLDQGAVKGSEIHLGGEIKRTQWWTDTGAEEERGVRMTFRVLACSAKWKEALVSRPRLQVYSWPY